VMKNPVWRFWTVEHNVGMLVAIILITAGRGVSKKSLPDIIKHKRSFWLFFIALIIILAVVPWPGREVARPLF
jgi:ABC-type branched-subunit amino acid transport system permease subunit